MNILLYSTLQFKVLLQAVPSPHQENRVTGTALYFIGCHVHGCLKAVRSSGTKIKGTAEKAIEYVSVGAAEQQVTVSPLLPVCVLLPAVFQVHLR